MLNFLAKKQANLLFEPNLTIYDVQATQNSKPYYTVRINSGDEANINKTLKIESSDIVSIELELEGFNEYESLPASGSTSFITGKSYLKATYNSKSTECFLLADHKIAVNGLKSKEKNKSEYFKFPPVSDISNEIKEIWNEEFSYCLDDLYDNAESKPKKKNSIVDKFITGFCIIAVLFAGYLGISKFMNHDVGSKLNTENTLLDEAVKNQVLDDGQLQNIQTTPDYDQKQMQKNIDQESLEEFGLDSGIKLD